MKRLVQSARKVSPAGFVFFTAVFISGFTRLLIIIFFIPFPEFSISFIPAFFIGLCYDLAVSIILILPLVLHLCFTNNFIYTAKGKLITLALATLVCAIFLIPGFVPKDYSRLLSRVIGGYIAFRIIVYILLCFAKPSVRVRYRAVILFSSVFFYATALCINAVGEVIFWQEFSVRYNFIAVDYLVYTNEVLGNIRESYPLFPILSVVIVFSLIICFISKKYISVSLQTPLRFSRRMWMVGVISVCSAGAIFFCRSTANDFSNNNFSNEIAGNGINGFVKAFNNNELDFFRFYKTLPDSVAFSIVRRELNPGADTDMASSPFSIGRNIKCTGAEKRMNVVLITVESLSASFMSAFGNTEHLTPRLDSLAAHSLFFTNFYAAGTRTVRGLEAVTLSVPPLPGQSLIKRKNNENLFSLGTVFKSKGYTTQFIYGGYSYFDNMKYFFSHNNYDVIDRTALSKNEISYENIWGVADEDIFRLGIRTMNDNFKMNKPFFTHIMTVSNHRPFTYPDGRIDISPSAKSRAGGVKYTDYAIGKFMDDAAREPWFQNTVFVIVADHCASAAGKQDLPVKGYRIPLIIYSPSLAPQKIDMLAGQIDIAPTIFGLLNFSYKSYFFGNDIFKAPPQQQRAFISTYRGLGFMAGDELVIQSPPKKIQSFRIDARNGDAAPINNDKVLTEKAQAFYQVAAIMMKNKTNR